MWSGKEEFDDAEEVFDEDAERKRDERHYYRDLILRSVATLGIGTILSAFLHALGFRGFLVALALCGFTTLFVRHI